VPSASPPPVVFGRSVPEAHPFHNQLTDWEKDEANRCAMSLNIRYDHRVSKERADSFERYCHESSLDGDRWNAIERYHEDRIRTCVQPDFLDAALNGQNWMSKGDVSEEFELVRVLDLNGLRDVYFWAKEAQIPPFEEMRPEDFNDLSGWLNPYLENKPAEEIRYFIERILLAMRRFRREKQVYQPSWAAAWRQFQPYAAGPANVWLHRLGIFRMTYGRWCVLLKYTLDEIGGPLVKPTQLDAGRYAYHFPSPKGAFCGHPMDLSASAKVVLSEFIHQQFDHDIRHFDNAGGQCKKSLPHPSQGLSNQRKAHHDLLEGAYQECIHPASVRCWELPDSL
jgi:hypothetical protein